jgi:hypothetical protein
MESLPFWEMESRNDLVIDGKAFCLAKPGKAYALYLPSGGSVTVNLPSNVAFEASWWNPANGKDASFQNGQKVRGGALRFTAPGQGDWALRIMRR